MDDEQTVILFCVSILGIFALFGFCHLIIFVIQHVFGFLIILGQTILLIGWYFLKTTFFAVMIVLSYLVLSEIKTAWKYWKTGKHPDDGQKTQNIIYTERDCVICYERQSNILLLPCLHLCICEICCRKLYQSRCPICRETIEDQFKRISS